ncbi:MAG: ABC transporter permease [Deltaproteobacteria bacterium]|jgi:heme exporter protein B|nr:ABC transporter permease [Deltaproteobacteria bacterium]MBT4264423.1 ABC transporter permease [Deltaproteobacteria bacterium]MBT4643086.1 ABC transporter permease [Deltaproteobacteria bacterium]MBT6498888.1 ABC transporter permease [Deltaproteobacteria bacterium]MBT6616098.1 ABC transporter permease [Deltaproteobacteria bacterium]
MFSDIWTILAKDIKLDLRSMENFFSMLFFSIIILLVFAFALPSDSADQKILAPGIFWVTFLLSGMLSLNKSFQMEKENGCMEALLVSPTSRGAIFFGKMAGNTVFIMIIQAMLIPLFSLLFVNSAIYQFGELLLLSFVSTIGFCALGTLLSGITTDLRFKDILLPILLFPLLVPLLLASVKITQSILGAEGIQGELDWLKLLIGFDLIFLIIAYLTFDYVMEI